MTAQKNGNPAGQTPLPENRHETGFRGPSPDVGKATQIKPGDVRNPGGRPKTKLLSQAIREEREALAEGRDTTKAQALARTLVTNGLKAKPGQSTAAIREAVIELRADQYKAFSSPDKLTKRRLHD